MAVVGYCYLLMHVSLENTSIISRESPFALYTICRKRIVNGSSAFGFSCSLMSKLRSFGAGSCPSDFGCMLETMCQWKKGGDVLELIYSWLQPCLVPEPANNRRVFMPSVLNTFDNHSIGIICK